MCVTRLARGMLCEGGEVLGGEGWAWRRICGPWKKARRCSKCMFSMTSHSVRTHASSLFLFQVPDSLRLAKNRLCLFESQPPPSLLPVPQVKDCLSRPSRYSVLEPYKHP